MKMMEFPVDEEKIMNLRVLTSISLRKIRETHPNLEDTDWEACNLPEHKRIEATGAEPFSGVIKIRNGHPAWKCLFEAQRREGRPFCFDTFVYGMDGIVPIHHVYLLFKVKWLTKSIVDAINKLEPPSEKNPIRIYLPGVKINTIKVLLSMFCCGQAKVSGGEKAEIRSLMRQLNIKNRKFQLFPFTQEEIPKGKFLWPLLLRVTDPNYLIIMGDPEPSTSVQLVPAATSTRILDVGVVPEIRELDPVKIVLKAEIITTSEQITKHEDEEVPQFSIKSEVDQAKSSIIPLEKDMTFQEKLFEEIMTQKGVDLEEEKGQDKDQAFSQAAPFVDQLSSEQIFAEKQPAKTRPSSPEPAPLFSQQLAPNVFGLNVQNGAVCKFTPRFLPRNLYHPRRVESAPQASTFTEESNQAVENPEVPATPTPE